MKIIISESQYKKLLGESYEDKILELIKSGDSDNIDMAFQLAKGVGVDITSKLKERGYDILLREANINAESLAIGLQKLYEKEYISISRSELPIGLLDLKNLTSLKIFNRGYSELPEWFSGMNHLKYLSLEQNVFRTLPSYLSRFDKLETLVLDYNEFDSIPKEILGMKSLKWLDMVGNKISDIDEVEKLEPMDGKLKQIRLDMNPFSEDDKEELQEMFIFTEVIFGEDDDL